MVVFQNDLLEGLQDAIESQQRSRRSVSLSSVKWRLLEIEDIKFRSWINASTKVHFHYCKHAA